MKKSIMPEIVLFDLDKVVKNIYIQKKGFKDFCLHSHDFYEFEYVIEGKGKCYINGKEHAFEKGDVSFATPLDVHGYKGEEDFTVITVHFRLSSLDKKLVCVKDIDACVVKCSEEMKKVFEILGKIDVEENFGDILCEKTVEMLVILFVQMLKGNEKSVLPKEINYAVEYINLNFKENINLEIISGQVGYSKEHFCRQFKKYTGMSYLKYLTGLRLAYARNLLDDQEYTVTQVCYECGFGCLRSFNRAFKEKYGCTPQSYKHQKLS